MIGLNARRSCVSKSATARVDLLVDIERFELPIAQFLPEASWERSSPHALLGPTMWILNAGC